VTSTVWDVAHQWLSTYTYAVDTADLDALTQLCADVTVGTPNGQTASGKALADIYRPIVMAPDDAGRRRSAPQQAPCQQPRDRGAE
jgi:hypothetical protein